ncbi:LEAF RUST 10 DISEASE-RESISTANCE LOCUS RECEPTOR-LIKE PROTEIN KINASE-like 1.1 [Eucalyptus grandis]|uniref:LEAF RUST 10 DISEASE-RESISTANCE LOCUS RECEPTOR-LIKE PROTEIN KINASE-like 1.1 n=1 Tax=Eucalyptus grandis TaxID=71139 RepID=UPI00192EC146|nr:LEAF RUST 10 DISEASE-RESISTANCE LOCUS RECEPTOR-LIKE PROTEIN KINASE-like 1.1 [Eucalyptus grandis]
MGVESSISSNVLLRLVISILTIISLEDWVPLVSFTYGSCKSDECGKVMIGYPFGNHSEPCCPQDRLLKLNSLKKGPLVYDNQSLRLISEFGRTGNACFTSAKESSKKPGASDTDVPGIEVLSSLKSRHKPHLAFLRNCTSSPNGDYSHPNLTCPSFGANQSYVALIGRPEDLNLTRLVCESQVIVPVELAKEDREKKENDKSAKEKLKHGFRLQWNLTSWESCVKCNISGGKCWEADGSFLCICSGKAYPRTCKGGNNHAPLKIGLGSGFGALALASILLCSFIYMIRHKQRHCFSIFCSRHAPSDSSLKANLEVGNVYFRVSIFTEAELEEATNHFDSAWELGDGGFGIVYYGKLRDGREVAVKRLYEHNYRRVKQFMTEVEILTRLRHKNLVSLYGCTSRQSRELLLVYEYIPNGTVADHLHGERAKQDPLRWHIRISIAIETATALAYLHASDIIHRDVKTNNILLDNNFSIKVADFGLSRLFPNNLSHVSTAPQGTPGYVDPEYHQCYQLTEKSDVYSFGVVLVELISSMPAVDISRDRHEINLANLATSKIRNHEFRELMDPNLGFESDPEINRMIMAVAELAFRCLQQDKDMRPSMETVLEELKAISSGTHELDKSKDVSYDNSAGRSENPPPLPECDNVGLLKNMKSPTSPVSVTQKWGSSGSSSAHSG